MSSRSRTPLVLAVVVAVVGLLAVAAVVASRGDDDGGGSSDGPSTSIAAPEGTEVADPDVTVTGTALAPLTASAPDPAVGTPAPGLAGTDYTGQPVEVAPGTDGPMLVVFLAHWCPHCNNEVPVLLDWAADGGIPESLQVVGVSTAAAPDRPNYPPGEWLAAKGWDWPVIADDTTFDAANAYGVTSFPFLTFIDADGNVTARASGELPVASLQELADATVAG